MKGMAWAAAGEKSVANKMFSNRVRVLAVAGFIGYFLLARIFLAQGIGCCDARHRLP
jgi:hypothetical protein